MAEFDKTGMAQQRSDARVAGRAAMDEGLRSYMLRVYNYMALGVAGTAIIAMYLASNPALMQAIAGGMMMWVLFGGVLLLGFLSPRLIFSGSTMTAHACFWAYVALWGALISPMIASFLNFPGGDALVIRALLITSVTFGSMSFLGYVTKRDLSPFATFFFMATIGLLIAIVVNAIFFKSTGMSLVTSGLVVLVFAGITAWETKEMYHAGDDGKTATSKAIFGAFALYGSFITLFIHILNILGIMRE
jgi:FtsH-binding integral membrane protein